MSLILALAAAAATHSVSVDHHGQTIGATYTARAHVRTKTVGAKTPNRMDMQRCRWTATVVVDRALNHAPALARTIPGDASFSGSEHGACPRGDGLEKRIAARHSDALQSGLMAAVERDRAPLMAELDQVRAVASN